MVIITFFFPKLPMMKKFFTRSGMGVTMKSPVAVFKPVKKTMNI